MSQPLLLDTFALVLDLSSLQVHAVESGGLPGPSDTVLNSLAGFSVHRQEEECHSAGDGLRARKWEDPRERSGLSALLPRHTGQVWF